MSTLVSRPEHFLQATPAITVSFHHFVKPLMTDGYQRNPSQDQNKDKELKILNPVVKAVEILLKTLEISCSINGKIKA